MAGVAGMAGAAGVPVHAWFRWTERHFHTRANLWFFFIGDREKQKEREYLFAIMAVCQKGTMPINAGDQVYLPAFTVDSRRSLSTTENINPSQRFGILLYE